MPISALSFTSDGKYLASASYGAGEVVRQGKPRGSDPIQVRDALTFEKVKGFYSVLYGAMRSLHYAHDDKALLAGGGGKSIEIWDVESGRIIDTIQGFSDVVHVAPSPDGKRFATVAGDEIKIWEFVR